MVTKKIVVVLLFAASVVMPVCGYNADEKSAIQSAKQISGEGAEQGGGEVIADIAVEPTGSNANMAAVEGAQMTLEKTKFDMGLFELKGKPRTIEVPFTNTGDAPLVILRTELNCTCLSAEYPRKPVPAGQSGVIKITYTPKKEAGKFQNTVKVITNTEIKSYTLFIDCEVVEK